MGYPSIDYISKEHTQGIFTERARDFFLTQIRLLKGKGADGIILGCTELPTLMKSNEEELPLLSTTHLHAKLAVDFILDEKLVVLCFLLVCNYHTESPCIY
ncbi:aspartate/glutamate racemase family protein [Pareuzebyella sediminis]|uniref:aspartate/glutamate racemase family protein n=1 Tax=Pareuzebyella sediminis TaxID=2607998 RepID=UPI0011EEED61|nr:aspartate/glutamate racemase family protein [Pareuzebyella sediminis]